MKFCNISWRVNNVAVFFSLILFVLHINVKAQVSTSSPYSRYGVGDLQFGGFTKNLGMGGLTLGLVQPLNINFSNPASYHAITLTTFEAAANGSFFELKNSTQSGNLINAEFGYLAMGFPLRLKKWGLSFGLLPYSNVGYSIKDTMSNVAGEKETHLYEGSGGLTQFYVGTGWSPVRNFSVGINASFVFGTISQIRRIEFPITSGYYNTRLTNETIINDFFFSLGALKTFDSLKVARSDSLVMFDKRKELLEDSLEVMNKLLDSFNELKSNDSITVQVQRESIARSISGLRSEVLEVESNGNKVIKRRQKGDWSLSIGLTGSPSLKLKGKHTSLAQSYTINNNQEFIRDTIYNNVDKEGKLVLPMSLGLGFAFRQANHWIAGADFSMQNWQDYSLFGERDSLADSWRVAGGFQWTPNERSIKSYLNLVQYRFGVHYEQTYLQLRNSQLNDYGLSIGFGLPMKRVATTLQFSVEAGRRGTTANNLVELNYIKCSIGFTLNDRWFIKQKFD